MLTKKELAQMIDHSLLKPDKTYDDIKKACKECVEYGFKTISVNSNNVKMAADILKGTGIGVDATAGFPLGAMATGAKVYETRDAVKNGATEIDMVLDIGALKSKDYGRVRRDINEVVKAAEGRIVKVILENCYLTKDEIVTGCKLCEEAEAHFVKTSTGFAPGGAVIEDVILMRKSVSPKVQVKVAGGVRSFKDFMAFYQAGATRCGTSNSLKIMAEFEEALKDNEAR